MDKKTYEIDGRKYRLKPFEDYTHNEENKIKKLLGIDDNDNSLNFSTTDNNSIFPLLLISNDSAGKDFDFNNMPNSLVYEVITDWIAARIFFIQNMGNYFGSLLQKKLPLMVNMKENMEQQEIANPN